jgi:hypothetical protein
MAETMSKQQLADLYKIHRTTLYRWLKIANLNFGDKKLLTKSEVQLIYNKIGEP